MRIYISGPITGRPDYMERFAAKEAELRAQGYDVLNPAAMNAPVADMPRERIMHLCRAELTCCEAIYMMRGWKESEGARMERGWAREMGMEAVFEGGDGPTEDKQEILDAICAALMKTEGAGTGNPLKEIRYVRDEKGKEWAVPVFEDGKGSRGEYAVNITGDSGTAMFLDVANKFVRGKW